MSNFAAELLTINKVMDKKGIFLLIVIGTLSFSSCRQSDEDTKEKARIALKEVMRMDKSGIDVDNDSLIRTAFFWYDCHENDTLYARCQYYMGKYYMLNDSLERAADCLNKSANMARQRKDTATLCLALDKLSKVVRQNDPNKAVDIANESYRLYSDFSAARETNKVYSLLCLSEAMSYANDIDSAIIMGKKAADLALTINEKVALSDAYQDLSNHYGEKGDWKLALVYAKKASKASSSLSRDLMLALAYINNDSTVLARSILNSIPKTIPTSDKYTYFYFCHLLAMKEKEYDKAVAMSDSAFNILEQIYSEQLSAKQSYYQSMVEKDNKASKAEAAAEMRMTVIIIGSLSVLVIIVSIIWHYRERVRHEKEVAAKDAEMQRQLLEKEMKNRNIQMNIMRNYLLKEVDIAEKIERIRNDNEGHIILSSTDWGDIEVFLDSVDNLFVSRLRSRFPQIEEKDIQLMMLLRLHMPQKTIASIYCISEKAVKQKLFLYKAKVGIEGEKTSLREFIEDF